MIAYRCFACSETQAANFDGFLCPVCGGNLDIRYDYETVAKTVNDGFFKGSQDLSRFVPDEVARRITSSDERVDLGQGEVREATILFADIANFTTIGEQLAPEQLINTLNEYFAVVAQPIERFNGVICQFQGDAILASFNLPEAHPDHAANAVNAAIEIQQLLVDRSFGSGINLRARIGINSGLVVGGLVGTPDRLGCA